MSSGCKIAVIGGGASGFFAAIHAAQANSNNRVTLFEKSNKLLSKVKISGGGRCNVTHNEGSVKRLVENYPRGGNRLKKIFGRFGPMDTVKWFEDRGVRLKVEKDGRMFPSDDRSQTIINTLLKAADQFGVLVETGAFIQRITPIGRHFELAVNDKIEVFDKVIIATGGAPTKRSLEWLSNLELKTIPPLPSLFTFNIPENGWSDLQGISMPSARIKIPQLKLQRTGPVLITHWGFSGPAVLALSSIAARALYDLNYQFDILISWIDENEEELRKKVVHFTLEQPYKKVHTTPLFQIPTRLWKRIIEKANIPEERTFSELVNKEINRLCFQLTQSTFSVSGKTTFKEEFVTSGGIDLDELDIKTFESVRHPGLYIIGEITNVDALTGGFNFQYAWTSGYIAGKHAGANSQ